MYFPYNKQVPAEEYIIPINPKETINFLQTLLDDENLTFSFLAKKTLNNIIDTISDNIFLISDIKYCKVYFSFSLNKKKNQIEVKICNSYFNNKDINAQLNWIKNNMSKVGIYFNFVRYNKTPDKTVYDVLDNDLEDYLNDIEDLILFDDDEEEDRREILQRHYNNTINTFLKNCKLYPINYKSRLSKIKDLINIALDENNENDFKKYSKLYNHLIEEGEIT